MSKLSLPSFLTVIYRSDIYLLIQMILAIGGVLFLFIYTFLFTQSYIGTDEVLALHYTIYLGIDYIGPWYYLYVLHGIVSSLFVINSILAWFVYPKAKVLSYILISTSTFLIALTSVYLIFIVILNQ